MANEGHNLTEVKKALKSAFDELDEADKLSDQATAQRREVYENLEGRHGVNRKAVKAARAFFGLAEDKQQGFDLSFELCREVGGRPWQPDLFMDMPEEGETEEAAA